MRSYSRTIMRFHSLNIYIRQPVESVTIVTIERERLELFEYPAKSLP